MFIPNNTCKVKQVVNYSMRGGAPTYGPLETKRIALVRLRPKIQKTSVRADSSASKGSSDEVVADCVLLFPADFVPGLEAIVEFSGFDLKVIGAEPRFAVTGKLDHFEVSLEYVSSED